MLFFLHDLLLELVCLVLYRGTFLHFSLEMGSIFGSENPKIWAI